jgi:hypothetical protein
MKPQLSLTDLIGRIDEPRIVAEARGMIVGGHLRCCASKGSLPCQWCDWAVVTPGTMDLIARIDDIRRVLNAFPSGLWWALAAWALQEPMTATGPASEDIVRPEVDIIWRGLDRALLSSQAELSNKLASASGTDGDLVKCCSRVAAIGSLVYLENENWPWSRLVPADLRAQAGAAFRRVDAGRLDRICTTEIEKLVGEPLFSLETEHVAESLAKRRQRSRNYVFDSIEPGSINELNLEASLRGLVERIHSIASAIEVVPGTVSVRLAADSIHMSKLVRKTVWSSCSIDWVQTFIDTTGAPCWGGREPGSLTVPWFVAAAIEGGRRSERLSAAIGEHPLREVIRLPDDGG